MKQFNRAVVDLASTDFCSAAVTLHPEKISVRVRNSVKKIILGQALPPASGDADLILSILHKKYKLPKCFIKDESKNGKRAINLRITDQTLSPHMLEALTKYRIIERTAMRLDPDLSVVPERSRHWHAVWGAMYRNNFLSDDPDLQDIHHTFRYADCYPELSVLLNEHIQHNYGAQIRLATEFLDSDTALVLDLKA